MMENKEAEKKRDKLLLDHEGRIREISDTIRRNNIRIIGIPEEEERERGAEGVLEQIIVDNFPYLGKDTYSSPGSTEKLPSISVKTGQHLNILKLASLREKILKVGHGVHNLQG